MIRWPVNPRRLIAALLLAVLVTLPVLDAFACAFEGTAVHATSELQAGPHDDEGDSRSHGACGHHHCHHASANILPDAGLRNAPFKRALPVGYVDTLPLTGVLEGLMRPPRA
ncbi:MAG: hypothetical protein KA132_00385 [Thauera sp.]|nr:hypothetical protein [Thauera sp.]